MCANIHDIKESDELFVQMLQAMKDIDNAGVDENNFNEVNRVNSKITQLFCTETKFSQ